MPIDAQKLTAMVDSELAQLSDRRVVVYIQALIDEPTVTMRYWDYGGEDERYPCWTVLRHPPSNTGIACCEYGFGPSSPWGLVFLEGDERRPSIGMDSSWFTTFLQAFFESQAAIDLPIWRVFKMKETTGEMQAISGEGEWDTTWAKVMALRESDPANQYRCWTSIQYERERSLLGPAPPSACVPAMSGIATEATSAASQLVMISRTRCLKWNATRG